MQSLLIEPHLLNTGNWNDTTTWERYVTTAMPPEELCSAASCVAITSDEKIVLTRVKRGWGMLGGHIEKGESPVDAMRREALEEGGFVVENYMPCGYLKITATKPTPHPDPTREYPFPISHIPFYLATSSQPLQKATGEEVLDTRAFAIEEIEKMDLADWPTIEAVWQIYLQNLERR